MIRRAQLPFATMKEERVLIFENLSISSAKGSVILFSFFPPPDI